MVAYVFDVDGTLTPSRGKMNSAFKSWFLEFQHRQDVYLVTGSDYDKTLEQVGLDVLLASRMVFNCCGNEIRRQKEIIYMSPWSPSLDLVKTLGTVLENDEYPVKTGKHIEYRTGLVNFSIVGRNATLDQRKAYFEFDQKTNHRRKIVDSIKGFYPSVDFTIAGETGIDIYERGCDKSQVLNYIKERPVHFFGDRTEEGGNDHAIALAADYSYQVKDWQHTWKILEDLEFVVDLKSVSV